MEPKRKDLQLLNLLRLSQQYNRFVNRVTVPDRSGRSISKKAERLQVQSLVYPRRGLVDE